tara:strand:+ start:43 stop:159 length:117 start_codon:yes stop_codon:yes gene_type:complete
LFGELWGVGVIVGGFGVAGLLFFMEGGSFAGIEVNYEI